jgi:hypothetical protein
MGDFVQDIVRNSVLAMISSLKGVNKEITQDLGTKIKIIISNNDGQTKKTNNGSCSKVVANRI